MYDVKGRKLTLAQREIDPGTTVHWAGKVLREVDVNGIKATLRNINGHLTLTWTKDKVEYDLNNYQDGVSADDLIKLARSLKLEGGEKK